MDCPGCCHHPLVKSDIQPLQSVHLCLLESISLKCTKCSQDVLVRDSNEHICQVRSTYNSQLQVVQPSSTQPTAVEQRIATNNFIMKKMLHNAHITVSTGGQVSITCI